MSGKIKVALCLSGEPRSSMFCFPYIYESFVNLGPEYEVDVYIHSWKNFRAFPLYNPKQSRIDYLGGIGGNVSYINQRFNHVLPVISEVFKNEFNVSNEFTEQTNFFLNSFLMLSSIQNCFSLIKESYDVYIRCRYDLIFNNKFKIYQIIEDILGKKYDIFIPKKAKEFTNHKKNNELNDQLAIGNFKAINSYSNIESNLKDIIINTRQWAPEIWLRTQLEMDNIKINEYFVDHSLVRFSHPHLNFGTEEFLDQ